VVLSGSRSFRRVLPNMFLEKLFLSKKYRSRSCFDEAIICGFTKTAPLPLEEPFRRSCAKHPLKEIYQYNGKILVDLF
jgi:hypothetical protein